MPAAVISYGAAASFGSQAGWAEQSSESNVVSDRSVAVNAKGDEVASDVHNERTEVSTPYQAQDDDSAIPTVLGAIVNSLDLTSIAVQTKAGEYATMTLTGHNHAANAHTACRSCTHGITLSASLGGVDFFGGTAGDNASVESSSLTISCEHTDIVDKDGDHLVGENRNGKAECEVVWNGVPSDVGGTGWDKLTTRTRTSNTGFLQTVVTGVKKLTMSEPA